MMAKCTAVLFTRQVIIIIIINLFAIFSYQIADIYHAIAGIRKTQSSTSWWPIINRTVVNILLRKNIQWNKKRKN